MVQTQWRIVQAAPDVAIVIGRITLLRIHRKWVIIVETYKAIYFRTL